MLEQLVAIIEKTTVFHDGNADTELTITVFSNQDNFYKYLNDLENEGWKNRIEIGNTVIFERKAPNVKELKTLERPGMLLVE